MREYPKTENLLARDPETRVLTRDYRLPEFEQIGRWLVTEKIDGTNIRVIFTVGTDGIGVDVRGRSDNATLPKNFVHEAISVFSDELLFNAFAEISAPLDTPEALPFIATLYGEGYGAGIQKGGIYSPKKEFAAFDLLTTTPDGRELWRTFSDVEAFCDALVLDTVPVIGVGWTTEDVLGYVSDGTEGRIAEDAWAEGVVARTDPYLFNYRGHRVMFKLKDADVQKMLEAEAVTA